MTQKWGRLMDAYGDYLIDQKKSSKDVKLHLSNANRLFECLIYSHSEEKLKEVVARNPRLFETHYNREIKDLKELVRKRRG